MAEFKFPKFVYKDKPISLDEYYRNLSEMSYQSPVEIIYNGFTTKVENDIYEVIQDYGVSVDKDELIKALQYDRNQYEKGFIDGCKNNINAIRVEIFEELEREINDALQSNYKVLPQIEQSESLWNRVSGKIDALRGMNGFITELKEKYTKEGE